MRTQERRLVSRRQWLQAREHLLAEEKELSRARDRLSEKRRALPWVRVDQSYEFERSSGRATLADLFDGKSQLIIYHFMFAPDWDVGCKSCSFWADGFERSAVHLAQRDVTLIAVSRAPLSKLLPFAERMGWSFPWVSSRGSSFNHDFGVSFTEAELAKGEISYNYGRHKAFGSDMPGVSVFAKDEQGSVFHTYSCYSRGLDMLNATYQYLDLVPKGRDESGLPYPMSWLRLRDDYET